MLKQLKLIAKGSLVLDIGCAESVLSHELVSQKFEVVGIDIRKYPCKNKFMHFLRGNCSKSCFRAFIFDAIFMISTIENIALFHKRYCQKIFDDEGDIKVMEDLQRILKPRGILILTTPFIGMNIYRVCKISRFYNLERLNRLIKGFQKTNQNII